MESKNIIQDFINGNLNQENRKKVSQQIKEYSKNKSEMKQENKQNFDADKAWDSFQSKISESKISRKQKNFNFFAFGKVAASIILLIGLSISGYLIYNNFSQTKFSEISTQNKIEEVKLPDGSIITLNHNSTIKFPENFSGKTRIIEFNGEAFFSIEKNPNKPFIIKTNNAKVKVLGTSFNVKSNKNNIIVNVKTGKVQLSGINKKSIKLTAGEEGKIKNNEISKSKEFNKNYLSWKTKTFVFNNIKLSKVLSEISKAYHTEIIPETEEIGEISFSSTLNNLQIDVLLDVICSPENLTYTKKDGKIIISK